MLNSQAEIHGSNPNSAELINEQLKQHQIVADWKKKKPGARSSFMDR